MAAQNHNTRATSSLTGQNKWSVLTYPYQPGIGKGTRKVSRQMRPAENDANTKMDF